jgi:hypothetical protein
MMPADLYGLGAHAVKTELAASALDYVAHIDI